MLATSMLVLASTVMVGAMGYMAGFKAANELTATIFQKYLTPGERAQLAKVLCERKAMNDDLGRGES